MPVLFFGLVTHLFGAGWMLIMVISIYGYFYQDSRHLSKIK
jgi:hypothetical protein